MSEPNQTWRSFSRLCTFFQPDERLNLFVRRGTADGKVIEPEQAWRERVQAWREKFALCFIMLVANAFFMGFGGVISLLKCGVDETGSYDWQGIKGTFDDAINHPESTCRALNMTMMAIMITVVAILAIQCICSLLYLLRFGRTFCKARRGEQCQTAKVIVTVPCYNEGEEELKKTIYSVRDESYPKDKKLLLFIADGNKKGTDRGSNYDTTPVILSHLCTIAIALVMRLKITVRRHPSAIGLRFIMAPPRRA